MITAHYPNQKQLSGKLEMALEIEKDSASYPTRRAKVQGLRMLSKFDYPDSEVKQRLRQSNLIMSEILGWLAARDQYHYQRVLRTFYRAVIPGTMGSMPLRVHHMGIEIVNIPKTTITRVKRSLQGEQRVDSSDTSFSDD